MAIKFKTASLILSRQEVTATGNNLYVNGVLVGTGIYQLTGDYALNDFVTGISGALQTQIGAPITIENIVYTTGDQLISGIKTFETGAKMIAFLEVGIGAIANGYGSLSAGQFTIASGNYSVALGVRTEARATHSFTHGYETIATGGSAHAEGLSSLGYANWAHAEGAYTKTEGIASHSEGYLSNTIREYSHAEGQETYTYGIASHVEGLRSTGFGDYSHTEGISNTAGGRGAHAEGNLTLASGDYSHSEGSQTISSGLYSHAEGENSITEGFASHAEGLSTFTTGAYSHAEGELTYTIGVGSHAEGYLNEANGDHSHAEGSATITYGAAAHAEGANTTASGYSSHAEGLGTISESDYSHAQGLYNRVGVSGLFQVGRGTSDSDRQDVIYVSNSGSNPSILSGNWNTESGFKVGNNFVLTGLIAGTNISINDNNNGTFTVNNIAVGGGSGTNVSVTGSSALTTANFTGLGSVTVTQDGNNVRISGAASSSSAGTKTYARFTARDNQPPDAPSGAYATLDIRNSILVLDFSNTASGVFMGIMPESANLSSVVTNIFWTATSATSNNCVWGVQYENMNHDIDTDSYDIPMLGTGVPNATNGIKTITSITGNALDSLAAGDLFRLRIFRDSVTDTMTDDAELLAIEIRGL